MGQLKNSELFYLHDLKKKLDPMDSSQLLAGLKKGQIPFYSHVYERELKKWVAMSQNKTLATLISMELKVASQGGASTHSLMGGWFVRDKAKSYGPFSLVQMIELYQQKRLHKTSLVQHSKTLTWRKFSEAQPFDKKSIQALYGFPGLKILFIKRQNPRISYKNSICIDSKDRIYEGSSWSLSKKGIGVVLPKGSEAQLEDHLQLVIQGNDQHGSVQAKAKVVSLHEDKGSQRIGLVFDQEITSLADYIESCIPSTQTKV